MRARKTQLGSICVRLARELSQRLNKPHYIFRPKQLIRRMSLSPDVELPWGERIEVTRSEMIGAGVARTGIHELAVSETIWRLLDPPDLAVDVGANFGYLTSLMATRARRVIAFEPHQELCTLLRRNVPRAEVHELAVSNQAGTVDLQLPPDFRRNMGTATVVPGGSIRTARLDELVTEPIGLLKVDVEGHELEVLEGAECCEIRDVIFEDHGCLPTPVSTLLERRGYALFGIAERFLRPQLTDPSELEVRWEAPNYLGTLEPERAVRRLAKTGWRVLLGRRTRNVPSHV